MFPDCLFDTNGITSLLSGTGGVHRTVHDAMVAAIPTVVDPHSSEDHLELPDFSAFASNTEVRCVRFTKCVSAVGSNIARAKPGRSKSAFH